MEQQRKFSPPAGAVINQQDYTYETIRSPFGEYLNNLLVSRGISGLKLSKMAGLNKSHPAGLICGYYHPSEITCQRICDALGVPFEEMWREVESSKARWGRKHKVARSVRRGFSVGQTAFLEQDVYDWLKQSARPTNTRRGRSVSALINQIVKKAMRNSEVTI